MFGENIICRKFLAIIRKVSTTTKRLYREKNNFYTILYQMYVIFEHIYSSQYSEHKKKKKTHKINKIDFVQKKNAISIKIIHTTYNVNNFNVHILLYFF